MEEPCMTTTDSTDQSATTKPTPEPTTDPAQDTTDWKVKYDEALAQSRKHEDRAKANANAARELETLRQSTMSDTEKAVAQAKVEARTETLREVGTKLAAAEVRVAAAGRNVDVDALLEGLDASKFIDVNGDPDTKAITAWVDRVAPAVDDKAAGAKRDLGLGVRGGQQASGDPAQEFAKFLGDQLKG
jgi:hypothetical protein